MPVPEPLSLDGAVETVRLVAGDAGQECWPHQLGLEGVASAGHLLRRVHEASRTWVPPADAVWAVPEEPAVSGSERVICHGDAQPANFAWSGGVAVGLFDWDSARPAPACSDVAYALEWLAPFEDDPQELARRGFADVPDRRGRVRAFLDGYGWAEPLDVVGAVVHRQQLAIEEVVHLGRAGHEPHASWVAQGWPARWRSKLVTTRRLAHQVDDEQVSER
ncbi:phosphotransferase [Quadrisphaera sp. INWT6]|nr:phosphotransferase [Quadrisphaera sp. INWT6]